MKGRILIVDNSTQNLTSIAVHLLNEGYNIATARCMIEALSLVAGYLPNLIISEVLMPYMKIAEFIEKLHRSDSSNSLPIILMSERANIEAVRTAVELGADAYLEKPIKYHTIIKTVEEVLVKARQPAMGAPYNQRKYERILFNCEAYFESEGISGFGVVSDISKGGIFLSTPSTLRPGAVINVNMKMLPGLDIEIFGEVRYAGRKDIKKGVGIKFVRMDPKAMQILERMIIEALKNKKEATPAAR